MKTILKMEHSREGTFTFECFICVYLFLCSFNLKNQQQKKLFNEKECESLWVYPLKLESKNTR